ncbi:MAG: exostosin family protein [Flavobacteriales bacterium]
MKLYYPKSHYNKQYRSELFPLLKPFIKGEGFTDEARMAMYGISEKDITICETPDTAEVFVLPMSWNYYTQQKQLTLALEFIALAKGVGKMVWSFIAGDYGVRIPKFDHVMVFRLGGYKSQNLNNHMAMPVFIGDYLTEHEQLNHYLPSDYSKKPIVGFCGQADASKKKAFFDVLKKMRHNSKSLLKLHVFENEPFISTSYLRAQLLKRLSNHDGIDENFILRKHYRAGITGQKQTHRTTFEFYNNILESQYVLCVRGGGNFSVRFYETLMMGRIPIYMHTDGLLPLSDVIDWKRHLVWVESHERHIVAEKVVSFHNNLTPELFFKLCESNRKLWEEHLTLKGFFQSVIQKTLRKY